MEEQIFFHTCQQKTNDLTLQVALQLCDEEDYPNISILLAIACTLWVTTCETERSESQLKSLKTYLCSTMTEEKLGSCNDQDTP